MRQSLIVFFLSFAGSAAFADVIAVIGTGKVGSALGTEFAAQGHTIVYGSRNPSSAAVRELVARTGNGATARPQDRAAEGADIVVLAVPGMLAGDITRNLGDLSGKIVLLGAHASHDTILKARDQGAVGVIAGGISE